MLVRMATMIAKMVIRIDRMVVRSVRIVIRVVKMDIQIVRMTINIIQESIKDVQDGDQDNGVCHQQYDYHDSHSCGHGQSGDGSSSSINSAISMVFRVVSSMIRKLRNVY